jgi:hypothetical protein
MLYKEKAQYCPGEICDAKSKQDIQRTSKVQLLIVIGFIAYVLATAFLFNDQFRKEPHALFKISGNKRSK